jgi:hypothetical protein
LAASQAQIGSSTTVFMLAGTTGSEAARRIPRWVALAAAFHAALARQQQDVVVVEDFHEAAPEKDASA